MDRLYNYDVGVWNDVKRINPQRWCRAFFKLGNYCEDVENNSTESFNNTINKAREKPSVPMPETIRRLAMARVAKRSAISNAHIGICTPYVTRFLAVEQQRASECMVTRSTNNQYEARISGRAYRVSLENRTCTCRKFDITGIPCEHAYGVIMLKKLVPKDYVCQWFRTTMWRHNYAEGIVPLRGAPFWPSTDEANVHIPPPPPQPTRKQPKHKKRIMHYGICGMADHNSRFHKKDAPSQVTSSQAETSQVMTQL